jgi:hypothetical protein
MGNKYRLAVRIVFEFKAIQIKWFGTHKEYDKTDVSSSSYRASVIVESQMAQQLHLYISFLLTVPQYNCDRASHAQSINHENFYFYPPAYGNSFDLFARAIRAGSANA